MPVTLSKIVHLDHPISKHLPDDKTHSTISSGIPEDPDEDTVEKIIELLEYLGYQVEADEIERANRVGEKSADKTTPRAIVVELVSFKLKQSILKEAAQKLRHTPYR